MAKNGVKQEHQYSNKKVSSVAEKFRTTKSPALKNTKVADAIGREDGELLLEISYPKGAMTSKKIKFVPIRTKICVVEKGRVKEAWYFNNYAFESAVRSVTAKFYENKIGEVFQYMAMKVLTTTRTRATSFMANAPKKRSTKYEVNHLTTFMQVGENEEETTNRLMEFGEYIKIALTEKEKSGLFEIHPFKQFFESEAPPGLVAHIAEMPDYNPFDKLKDMTIKLEPMESLDQYYMDEYINHALRYCFQVEEIDYTSTDNEILALGWKKFHSEI